MLEPLFNSTVCMLLANDKVGLEDCVLTTAAAIPDMGNPVQLVSVPLDGVPRAPPLVTKAPDVPTATPNAVATFEPRPETPVEIGNPVALVSVTLVGVPRMGVTNVGDVERTFAPVPVEVVTPVPPLATASVPATVTTPLEAVAGVRPVLPKEIVVTPPPPVPFTTQLVTPEVSDDRTYPVTLGTAVGNVSDHVPAVAAVLSVTVPDVEPDIRRLPAELPAVPSDSAPPMIVAFAAPETVVPAAP